jgi:cytochrome c553
MKGAAALFVFAGCCATLAVAQQPAAGKPDVNKGRTIATQVCAACHGVDGNSPAPANPKLAGQIPEYTVQQLIAFKSNTERKNAVMAGMAAPLSVEDMRNIAAYYGGQKPMQGSASNRDTVTLGQTIYRGGDVSRGLPACSGCHGATGTGMPSQYPRLAGQFAEYTEAQLKAFRSGERGNDPNAVMRAIAIRMTDAEMRAVSDYIAGLR